ncbi:MAG TPA: TetR/AcrR family transcriptional regulator [Chitinophagales bacterium]|nr:TetR/AcrR family transcriptional regulator [Chitinophagales bacterium]HRK26857.1 TetR/AcrR family transcriptional regulator [Chitinophagales bacterium]
MKNNIKQPWVEAGYHFFALHGPNGLKVQPIARYVYKSKSSFYHLFADTEVFTQHLLRHHQARALVIARQAALCTTVPNMINLLLNCKTDILFNRQLRIHRHIPHFKTAFETANNCVVNALLPLWANALGLAHTPHLAKLIMNLTIENFYLSVTADNLTSQWLMDYLYQIQLMVKEMSAERLK